MQLKISCKNNRVKFSQAKNHDNFQSNKLFNENVAFSIVDAERIGANCGRQVRAKATHRIRSANPRNLPQRPCRVAHFSQVFSFQQFILLISFFSE